MNDNLRIAIIGAPEAPMVRMLEDLDPQPRLLRVEDLYADAPAVAAFAPHLLLCPIAPQSSHDLGAIRLLRSLLPDLRVVLVVESDEIEGFEQTCEVHDFLLLASPYTLAEIENTIARAVPSNSLVKGADYLLFAQGICDEINNPLMSASGHLQLLESSLADHGDDRALAQVASIRKGLDRISQTMLKVRDMARASSDSHIPESFAVASLLAQIEERCSSSGLNLLIGSTIDLGASGLRGDINLLSGALYSLGQVCRELSGGQREPVTLDVSRTEGALEFRMRVESAQLQGWELPRAFEPYHLNLVLRGTTLGLDLFLVRLVANAHGGDAVARRLSTNSVEFQLALPSSAPFRRNS